MTTNLHLALEVDGPPTALDIDALARTVADAEAAGFALVTIADSPQPARQRIEAGVRAAYLARRTDRIGLAPTLHVTTTEPFHLATQLASLDHASLGRAAWVVGAAHSADALATVGRTPLGPDALHRETADVIEVARQLWDSWEDDAVIRDVAASRFLDPRRVHHIEFEGPTFSIVGPLITPRPPRGQVVVVGAHSLGVDRLLDIALVGGDDLPALARQAAEARQQGAALAFADLPVWSGDPTRLTESLGQLAGVVDGVRLHVADLETDLPILTRLVLPRIGHSVPAPGATLRDTLGLPRPANRYAIAN